MQSLLATPFTEQRNIGFASAQSAAQFIAAYAFLAVLFVLSALAFLPVGQLCGRLMARREQLRAYALNLVGSLAGVVLLLAVSALWTPPLVWFALLFALLLAFQAFDRRVLLAGGRRGLRRHDRAGLAGLVPVGADLLAVPGHRARPGRARA